MHRPPPEHSRSCSTKRTAPPARQTHTSEAGTGPALPPSHMSLSRCVRAGLPPASHLYSITPFPALSTRARPTQKKRQGIMPWRVAPQVRLELTTLRLTAECSAIELLRIIFSIHLFSYVLGAGKTFVPPAPLGSRQLPTLPSRSQLSTISVWRLNFCVRYGYRWCPPAIVTGNFSAGKLLSRSPSPHLQNCTAIELTRKHSLFQIFRLFPSRSPRPPLSRFLRFLRLLLDGFPSQIKPSTD